MRKHGLLFKLLLIPMILVACSSGADDNPRPEATDAEPPSAPTLTLDVPTKELPTLQPNAYPALATPVLPNVDSGYPANTALPTQNPYPGGLATIMHPMGLQCEDAFFTDLSAAVGSLEEAGIVVAAAEEIGLEVCEACGCATSMHFRVQIHAEDLARALEMGWQR